MFSIIMLNIWSFLLESKIWTAVTLTSFLLISYYVMNIEVRIDVVLTFFFLALAIYSFDSLEKENVFKLSRDSKLLQKLCFWSSLFACIAFIILFTPGLLLFYTAVLIIGALYATPLIPLHGRMFKLKDIPLFKVIWLSFIISAIIVGTPLVNQSTFHQQSILFNFIFCYGISFVNLSLCDMVDVDQDKNENITTLITLFGIKRSKFLLVGTITAISVLCRLLLSSFGNQIIYPCFLYLFLTLFVIFFSEKLIKQKQLKFVIETISIPVALFSVVINVGF